jgi:hypothetical protein
LAVKFWRVVEPEVVIPPEFTYRVVVVAFVVVPFLTESLSMVDDALRIIPPSPLVVISRLFVVVAHFEFPPPPAPVPQATPVPVRIPDAKEAQPDSVPKVRPKVKMFVLVALVVVPFVTVNLPIVDEAVPFTIIPIVVVGARYKGLPVILQSLN